MQSLFAGIFQKQTQFEAVLGVVGRVEGGDGGREKGEGG